jgi:TetR/AcrR family transcriptional repressor of nem operon
MMIIIDCVNNPFEAASRAVTVAVASERPRAEARRGGMEGKGRSRAMKLSKEQAARNRQRIVEVAAQLFRERGIDGVGVADLMKAAGFTHGGFYNHFPSKEALAAEACGCAFDESISGLKAALAESREDGGAAFSQYLEGFLSSQHRDNLKDGCPTAGLVTDAARQGEPVQAVFAEGIETVLTVFAGHLAAAKGGLEEGDPSAARRRAVALLSEMVGALVLSRAVGTANPLLSEEILNIGRRELCG